MRQETKRLYLDDTYRIEFEARVVDKGKREKETELILDQTCFYPESGGQPSDTGQIDGIDVIHVLEEEGRIVHLLAKDIEAKKVKGKIHWETRFDHMQQHSGQHILSQSFFELLEAETRSFHLGETVSTLEMGLQGISEEDVERVEKRANEIVFQDREVKYHYLPEEDVGNLPLRRPPKKKGIIRVVEVSEYDYSACGGTHVRRTGEVGLIKILRWEKIRGNMRFEFVCGKRALQDYTLKNTVMRELSSTLTVHEKEVLSAIDRMFAELKSQKTMLKKMRETAAQYEAQEIIQKAKGQVIKEVFTDKTHEEVKFLALHIIHSKDFIVLFGLKAKERGHLIMACGEGFHIDMRELVPVVSPLIDGKGGGNPSLVELVGEKVENIAAALDKAQQFIQNKA